MKENDIQKHHAVGTDQNVNKKIVERCKVDNPNTPIQDRSLSWLGTDTSIKVAGLS